MPKPKQAIDGLEEVQQLNRLFLNFLQDRPAAGQRFFGLPADAARAVGRASRERLDQLAQFPRALFTIDLRVDGQAGHEALDTAQRVLQLTLLLSAWNLSRRSGYSSRLLLRLEDAEIRRLRTMSLADLTERSQTPGLIRCTFGRAAWLWRDLLAETRPEWRRRLLLIGLQPETPRLRGLRADARLSASL